MTTTININELLNSDSALTPKVGDLVFDRIAESIKNNNTTVVNFKGIKYMTTAFLNAAIGQLYSRFDSEVLNKFLKINISESDLPLLSRVLKNAKMYFEDKNTIEGALD